MMIVVAMRAMVIGASMLVTVMMVAYACGGTDGGLIGGGDDNRGAGVHQWW